MDLATLREQIEEQRAMLELKHLQALHESLSLYNRLVDPREFLHDDGEEWLALGVGSSGERLERFGFDTEQELRLAREECRILAMLNEFAINGHENRISYVIGTGHGYRAVTKKKKEISEDTLTAVQESIDEFVRVNNWQDRQQERMRRLDRDGESFVRYFPGADGVLRVRFVEPAQVSSSGGGVPAADTFGIKTDRDDVETVLGYWIGGDYVDADAIQHHKINVDANVKRGVPTFYPVRDNLKRAERLLRNMAALTTTQASIAMIRKVNNANVGGVRAFVDSKKDMDINSPYSADPMRGQVFRPGTILTASGNVDYEFPGFSINAESFVGVMQGILRAVAARLCMPEFMFTSDASNANYSSTMVAEGPAVKMFQRVQRNVSDRDLQTIRRAVQAQIDRGRLPDGVLEDVDIVASFPTIETRDKFKEARTNQVLKQEGVLSIQTWSEKADLDYEAEQSNIREHFDNYGDLQQEGLPPEGEGNEQ